MIEIHRADESSPELLAEILGNFATHFGILRVNAETSGICITPTVIYFSVDCSASMGDICKDGRTKMHQIIHSITNILHILAETSTTSDGIEFYVGLDAFDDTIHQKIAIVGITPQNVNELAQIITTVRPMGSTNIELALKNTATRLTEYRKTFPFHRLIHIQLTDGDITEGEPDPTKLAQLVSEKYTNIFLGYGSSHNYSVLQTLGSKKRGDYRFIDKLENAGLVYGEIMHGILYPAVETPEIWIEHGEIYDWTTNTWSSHIITSAIASGIEKIFHVRTTEPNQICGELLVMDLEHASKVELLDKIVVLPELICAESGITDLSKFMYRQKTQQLLFTVRNYNMRHDQNPGELKRELKKFYKTMKSYVVANDLINDPFMKILLDDIYISFRTLGTNLGQVYSNARQTSQGRQHTYNVTNVDEDENGFGGGGGGDCFIYTPTLTPIRRMNATIGLDTDNDITVPGMNMGDVALPGLESDDESDGPLPPQAPPKLCRVNTQAYTYDNHGRMTNDITGLNLRMQFENEDADEDDEDYEFLEHTLSENTTTPYTSPQMISLMRTASSGSK